jgi:hypothetical protein
MSVLWEIPRDNYEQVVRRRELMTVIGNLSKLVGLWMDADALRPEEKKEEDDDDTVMASA